MYYEHLEQFIRDIGKGGARVDDTHVKFVRACHQMIIHTDTLKGEFVSMSFPRRDPGHILANVIGPIIPSDLKIATVLTQAEGKHRIFNDLALFHNLKDGAHLRCRRVSLGHPKYSIRLLEEKEVGLLCGTPESKVEPVEVSVVGFPKVDEIFHQKA